VCVCVCVLNVILSSCHHSLCMYVCYVYFNKDQSINQYVQYTEDIHTIILHNSHGQSFLMNSNDRGRDARRNAIACVDRTQSRRRRAPLSRTLCIAVIKRTTERPDRRERRHYTAVHRTWYSRWLHVSINPASTAGHVRATTPA